VSATQGKHKCKSNKKGKSCRNRQATAFLKDTPRRAAMDPQRLVQRLVERGAVIAELLPQLLLRLSLGEVGRWRIDALPLPLRARCGTTRGREAGARRRGLGAAPRAPRHHAAVPPPHKPSSPGARGLMWASLPTGPIQAAGRRRPGSPPPSPGNCRRGRAQATSTAQRPPRL
jgi:hypothetical protein